jgi:hypothetical protein
MDIEAQAKLLREQIKKYFAKPETAYAYYRVYYPQKTEKKFSKHQKLAIEAIAYTDFAVSVSVVLELIAEVAPAHKTLQDLRHTLTQHRETPDFAKLLTYLHTNKSNLQNLLLANTLPAQKISQVKPIVEVWLEGIYWHACIREDRKQINALSKDQAKKVQQWESEQSLPGILAILTEAKHLLQRETAVHEQTLSAVHFAIALITDVHEKLYLGMTELPSVLINFNTEMLPKFVSLIEKLSYCKVSAAIHAHVQELEVWLEGLYLHNENPPDKGWWGNQIEATKENIFYQFTKKTKKDVAKYYHEAAEKLRLARTVYENENKTVETKGNTPFGLFAVIETTPVEQSKEIEAKQKLGCN